MPHYRRNNALAAGVSSSGYVLDALTERAILAQDHVDRRAPNKPGRRHNE